LGKGTKPEFLFREECRGDKDAGGRRGGEVLKETLRRKGKREKLRMKSVEACLVYRCIKIETIFLENRIKIDGTKEKLKRHLNSSKGGGLRLG